MEVVCIQEGSRSNQQVKRKQQTPKDRGVKVAIAETKRDKKSHGKGRWEVRYGTTEPIRDEKQSNYTDAGK